MPSDREPEPDESVEYYLAKARELLNPKSEATQRLKELEKQLDEIERNLLMKQANDAGFPFVDLDKFKPEQKALDALPAEITRQHESLPIKLDEGILYVAMGTMDDLEALDAIKLATRLMIRCVLAPPRQIERALARYYPVSE